MDLLGVQGTLKSLLQHHSSKASILWCSAFFTVQLSHLYMTTGKTIALTRWTFVGKVMSLLFNMLSRLVISPSLLLIPSIVLFVSFIVFFSSDLFFFIFPGSLLKSSLCSSILSPSLSFLITNALKSLCGKLALLNQL